MAGVNLDRIESGFPRPGSGLREKVGEVKDLVRREFLACRAVAGALRRRAEAGEPVERLAKIEAQLQGGQRPALMDAPGQAPESMEMMIAVDAQSVGYVGKLRMDASLFHGDHSHPAGGPHGVVFQKPVCNFSLGPRKPGRHGRHDESILQRQRPDASRFEQRHVRPFLKRRSTLDTDAENLIQRQEFQIVAPGYIIDILDAKIVNKIVSAIFHVKENFPVR